MFDKNKYPATSSNKGAELLSRQIGNSDLTSDLVNGMNFKIGTMDTTPQYYGVREQIEKLKKLPSDAPIKRSDVQILLEMFSEVLEKQHTRIKILEDKISAAK
jgi:hypothetical protein